MNDNILEHAQLPGSLELAYVGDAIYEVAVRRRIVKTGAKVSALHRQAVSRVCAHAQSEAFGRVEPMLTPEEAAVARRARNAHQSPPRSADRAEYHRATALEAVVGVSVYHRPGGQAAACAGGRLRRRRCLTKRRAAPGLPGTWRASPPPAG